MQQITKIQSNILNEIETLILTRAKRTANRVVDYQKALGKPPFAVEEKEILEKEIAKETKELMYYLGKLLDGHYTTYDTRWNE
jgi:hypothetical protein